MPNNFFKTNPGRYILLGVLPVVLFLIAFFFKEAGGPYYLNYYDPGYVYLVNSINLSEFEDVGHTDHPGTSLQIFGAVILKILFFGKSDREILEKVFSDPEFYLNVLNKSLVLINCLALYLLGLFTYRQTSNLSLSIFIQLSPFISFEILYGLVIVSPENFLILCVLCISGVLFYYVYNKDSDKHMTALAIVCGIICGFGTVSKLTFLPVCLLPLILLKGLKSKLLFTFTAITVFVFIFLPALSNFSKFTSWFINLTVNSGIHGHTELSKFSLSVFLNNIVTIFEKDIFLLAVYLLIAFVIATNHFSKTVKNQIRNDGHSYKVNKVLISLFFTITFQILVVAKNYLPYAQYYIVPSLMFAVTGLVFLIDSSLISLKRFANLNPVKVYSFAAFIVIVFSVYEISESFREAASFRSEASRINILAREYARTEFLIPGAGTANEDCALALCTMYGYSGSRIKIYKELFSKLTSSSIYHNFWENNLFTLSDSLDINKTLAGRDKIIFQLMSVTTINEIVKMLKEKYGIEVKATKLLLQNGNMESLYEVELK